MEFHSTTAKPIPPGWRPDEMAFQVLAQHSIPREFVEDQVPEFELYWRERGEANFSWGAKFVRHVTHVWRRHQNDQARGVREALITKDWMPMDLTVNQLTQEGIPHAFIASCHPAFVLYWLEHHQVSAHWNNKFLEWVRRHWAQSSKSQARTADLTLQEHLTDRSWAK